MDSSLNELVLQSNRIIDEAFSLYSLSEMALAFNGGKDCCVVLHLLYLYNSKYLEQMEIIHFVDEFEFPEITLFIESTRKYYNLKRLLLIPATNLKQGLQSFKDNSPHIRMFFHGRRSTDPYAHEETAFTPSTNGWPEFMRVAPILLWDYHSVWKFLLHYRVPYPSLYDEGYTSLGSRKTTIPNSSLKTDDGKYLPAHKLRDAKDERLSRIE